MDDVALFFHLIGALLFVAARHPLGGRGWADDE
jgi:hypothetical protein